MRILVASDQWFPDRMGGVARVATDTARGWAARGHEVIAVVPRHVGRNDETIDDGVTVLRLLPRGVLPQTLTDPRASRRIASELGGRFDVVVAHSCTTVRGLLDAGLDAPLVYVFHASAADEARDLRARIRLSREWVSAAVLDRPLRRFEARAAREASSIFVLSEFSRGVLHETSPAAASRAILVSGAVDTTRFTAEGREESRERLGIDRSTRLVLTVRRIEPRMGLENLVAAAGLLGDIDSLRVAIAGSGSPAMLEALRDQLTLGGRLSLLGALSDEELPHWYRAADLFVLPTLAYEGFGLVTAEALASGTPVVGTPVGATPELLAPLDQRLVSRGPTPEQLAEAIRMGLALATPAFRQRCREFALARFSWDTGLVCWERALEDAVSERRAAKGVVADADLLAAADR